MTTTLIILLVLTTYELLKLFNIEFNVPILLVILITLLAIEINKIIKKSKK
jgi:predicted benzoate:H+ symporter BenE